MTATYTFDDVFSSLDGYGSYGDWRRLAATGDWWRLAATGAATGASRCRAPRRSEVPLRSHGSLSLNWALMAAGLIDRVQVTVFPVITGTDRASVVRETSTWSCWEADSRSPRVQGLVHRRTPH